MYLHLHTPSSFIKLQELPLISCHPSYSSLSPTYSFMITSIFAMSAFTPSFIHYISRLVSQSNIPQQPVYPKIPINCLYSKYLVYSWSKNFLTFFCNESQREREKKIQLITKFNSCVSER